VKREVSPNRRIVVDGGNYTPIPNELIRNRNVPRKVISVLEIITSFDPSYISIRKIAEMGKMGVQTVMDSIKWLCDHKILRYDQKGSKYGTNQYYLLERKYWDMPYAGENESVLNGDMSCSSVENTPVLGTGIEVSSEEEPNNIKLNKTKLKKNKKEILNNDNKTSSSKNSKISKLPLVVHEASEYYKQIFAKHFNGQVYPSSFLKQFEDLDLQNLFIDQSIEFAKHGGTVYGRVANEFNRLNNKSIKRSPEPRFLANDNSYTSYQINLNECVKSQKWPQLIEPFDGRFLISKTFQSDSEAKSANKAFNLLVRCKSIEKYERKRLENNYSHLPQLGPYLFNYYLIKSYLLFGQVSCYFDTVLKLYEKEIGQRLFRPDEIKVIDGINKRPGSLWFRAYAPKIPKKLSRSAIHTLGKKIEIPPGFSDLLNEENQEFRNGTKRRDKPTSTGIMSQDS
jgi:hypothetical protein